MTILARRRPPGAAAASRESVDLERDWVAQIRAGDQAAFDAMFRAYYDPLCRAAGNFLGSRDAAEDVVQDVFVRIWRDHEIWAVTNLRHYLYTAVRRSATSHYRHAAVRRRAAPGLGHEAASRTEIATADAELEAEEMRCRVERALALLPRRTREAFVLNRGEGLSYNEVALRMNISPKTVGVHIGNALAVLRKTLLPLVGAVSLLR